MYCNRNPLLGYVGYVPNRLWNIAVKEGTMEVRNAP